MRDFIFKGTFKTYVKRHVLFNKNNEVYNSYLLQFLEDLKVKHKN